MTPDRWGTTSRIVAIFILFYTLATLMFGVAIYMIGDRALREQLEDRIAAETDYLVHVYDRRGLDNLRQVLRRRDARGVNTLGYLLVDRNGRRLGGELTAAAPLVGQHEIEFRDHDGQIALARALTVDLRNGCRLTVAMELAPAHALRETVAWLLIVGFGVMLLGGIAGGIGLTRAIRLRLNAMNDTAQAIISGDMSQRVPATARNDEFDRLAQTLNTMLNRNSALIDNLRQVSSDIAHDLRTPLARLSQRLERISVALADQHVLREEVERAIEEAAATLSLFGAILRIAEVESGTLRRYFGLIDLSGTARRIADSYVAVAEDSGRSLSCAIEDGVTIVGDTDLMSQALVNLLENAVRHTPVATHIRVMVRRDGNRAILSVVDDGHGVPADQWPGLTRRFTRGDKSRSGPGFGLGLNLVQAVATVHDATLTIGDAAPGLAVTLAIAAVDRTAG